jgi:glyoxylase-like metal-dependent hydrolase (beta-lactamase superfamily II)
MSKMSTQSLEGRRAEQADLTEAVEQFITALGGREAVLGSAVETITATGWRHHPGWGTDPGKPEAVAEFSYTVTDELAGSRYRLALRGPTHLVPADLDYVEVGNGGAGHVTGSDFMFDPRPVDMTIPSWRVAARVRHLDVTSPLRLAHKLLAPGADITLTASTLDGRPTKVIMLREVGRPATEVHLDAVSALPTRVRMVEEHSPLGDGLVEVRFDAYGPAGQFTLPWRVMITVNGVPVHDETRSAIEVSPLVDATQFEIDDEITEPSEAQAAFSQYSTQWILTYVYSGVRFYFDLQTAPAESAAVDVAPGVKVIIGPSHNIMVVELADYVLAVEAPLYDEYTRAALVQVNEAFPGKPLLSVVATHFHYDHIGGIREFAVDHGLTVYAGEPTVSFFQSIFTTPHTVDPDRYASHPSSVTVIGVKDKLSLPTADGGELQMIRITSDHADDMMIVYLSSAKLVFESDLWNPTPAEPRRGAQRGRLATQVYDAIIELGLDVEWIVGGHLGTDGKTWTHIAPLHYLQIAADR